MKGLLTLPFVIPPKTNPPYKKFRLLSVSQRICTFLYLVTRPGNPPVAPGDVGYAEGTEEDTGEFC